MYVGVALRSHSNRTPAQFDVVLRRSVKLTETLLEIDLQPIRHFTDVGLHLTGLASQQGRSDPSRPSALSPVQAEVRAALLNHSRPPCPGFVKTA